MHTKKSAFTLVELIVVITILAVLGTIAFISLQGYSQDAKNAKVSHDLNTLASAIEIGLTNGTLQNFNSLITDDRSGINGVNPANTVTLYNNDITSTGTLDGVSVKYFVGLIDFSTLRQNGDDFKDADDNGYIAAVAYSGSTAYYQLAGQQKEDSGHYMAVIKGNYFPQNGDSISLISAKGSQNAIKNNANLGTVSDDTNLY